MNTKLTRRARTLGEVFALPLLLSLLTLGGLVAGLAGDGLNDLLSWLLLAPLLIAPAWAWLRRS